MTTDAVAGAAAEIQPANAVAAITTLNGFIGFLGL